MSKLEDNYLHIFTPSGMWGDQILNLFASHYHMQHMSKEGIIIHTAKEFYNPHHESFTPADKDILKFWTTFNFVKGIIFDVDQHTLPEDIQNSNYDIFPYLNYGFNEDYCFDFSETINFSSFPPSSFEVNETKVAAFQPISLKNKPAHHAGFTMEDFICEWDQCIKELLFKGYKIYAIGSSVDEKKYRELYPNLYNNSNIVNLMGKISMFEAINLVMNKASFVLSCDSWAGWYGIASRIKTGYAAGPLIESGQDKQYLELIKNKDVFFMDYSSKKQQTDNNIANWISKNA